MHLVGTGCEAAKARTHHHVHLVAILLHPRLRIQRVSESHHNPLGELNIVTPFSLISDLRYANILAGVSKS